MKRALICLLAALALTAPLGAQQKCWSLAECIEYALEQNIALQQRGIAVEDRENALKATQFSRLPSLSGNLSETYNIGRAQNREGIYVDKGSANTSVGVNASISVFQGFRINNQAKADKLSLEASTQDLMQARQDLSLQITAAYLQLLYAKEAEKIAEKQLGSSNDLLERTGKMVEGGRSSMSELYDAQSSVASAQSNLVDAQNSRQSALLDLAQAMNLKDFAQLDIAGPETSVSLENAMLSLTPLDSIYNDYISTRPSVMAAQKRVEQAKRNVKVAQSGFWPSINIGASYNSGYYSAQNLASGNGSFWHQLSQNGSPSFGISLSVPIFDRMSTYSSVRTARNAVRTQQLNLEQEKLNTYKEVQQAYINAKAAYGKYLAGLKSVEAARKAFEFEQKKYDSGRSTAYQYNELSVKLSNAQSQLSQARYSFILRAKILEFYKGEPLY